MTKQTYIGNGRNKNFFFTFPFFSPDEVVVKVNGIVAAGYGLFCAQGVSNQDFPFTGGHVKFTKPPKPTDIVTIERNLKYNRVIDYQETAKIQPTILNQDMNYFFESLKDIKSILDELNENYAEITDIQSLNDLKARITAVTEQIDNFAEEIESIGDITTIRTNINSLSQSVSDLASAITTHTTNIGTNTNDIAALKDASNFTTNGKNAIAHMAMPSNRYINLTLGASGTTYTAPSDGYVYFCKTATATNQSVKVTNETSLISCETVAVGATNWCRVWVPVSKNDRFTITYNVGGETRYFRFIYANGVQ